MYAEKFPFTSLVLGSLRQLCTSVMQGTVWGEPELRILCYKTWEDANGDNENRIK